MTASRSSCWLFTYFDPKWLCDAIEAVKQCFGGCWAEVEVGSSGGGEFVVNLPAARRPDRYRLRRNSIKPESSRQGLPGPGSPTSQPANAFAFISRSTSA
jgi:hypothetical protein